MHLRGEDGKRVACRLRAWRLKHQPDREQGHGREDPDGAPAERDGRHEDDVTAHDAQRREQNREVADRAIIAVRVGTPSASTEASRVSAAAG